MSSQRSWEKFRTIDCQRSKVVALLELRVRPSLKKSGQVLAGSNRDCRVAQCPVLFLRNVDVGRIGAVPKK